MLNFRAFYVVLPILILSVFISYKVKAQSIPNGLVGLSSSGPAVLYSINASTGEATPIVTLNGGASLTGLAYLQRTLYGTDLFGFPGESGGNDIGSISTGGIITFLSNQNGSANWHGLAANEAGGVMYSIDINNSDILTAQFPDGSVQTIGSGTGIEGRGMEYDDTHGILYALDDCGSLYTVSTSTGTSTLIGPTGISGDFCGLAYDECNGILYLNEAVQDDLYTLDITTGEATFVGSNGVVFENVGIDGLAWKGSCGPNPIPTLSEWGMISAAAGLGLIGVFFAMKRRKAQAGV